MGNNGSNRFGERGQEDDGGSGRVPKIKQFWTVVDKETGEVLAAIDVVEETVLLRDDIDIRLSNYEPVFRSDDGGPRFVCHNT